MERGEGGRLAVAAATVATLTAAARVPPRGAACHQVKSRGGHAEAPQAPQSGMGRRRVGGRVWRWVAGKGIPRPPGQPAEALPSSPPAPTPAAPSQAQSGRRFVRRAESNGSGGRGGRWGARGRARRPDKERVSWYTSVAPPLTPRHRRRRHRDHRRRGYRQPPVTENGAGGQREARQRQPRRWLPGATGMAPSGKAEQSRCRQEAAESARAAAAARCGGGAPSGRAVALGKRGGGGGANGVRSEQRRWARSKGMQAVSIVALGRTTEKRREHSNSRLVKFRRLGGVEFGGSWTATALALAWTPAALAPRLYRVLPLLPQPMYATATA